MAVVALADDDRGDGVEGAGDDVAVAAVEVARILVEEGGKEGGAEEGGGEAVAVGGGVALGVAGEAGAVAGEVALRLLDAGGDAGGHEGERVDRDDGGELELLAAGEGRGVGDVADEEVGQDAEDALVLFGGDLLFGEVFDGDGVDGGGDGFDAELNRREDDDFRLRGRRRRP